MTRSRGTEAYEDARKLQHLRPAKYDLIPKKRVQARPSVRGKFIFAGDQKFFIKGATYSAFGPNDAGVGLRDLSKVRRDLATMARHGINTIRIPNATAHTALLLDIAAEHNLRVMVGLSAEQYVGHLLDRKGSKHLISEIRSKVCDGERHPALLCYVLGEEIPWTVARSLGRECTERYLYDLYKAVKDEDPDALVTYVNYPSTEYLQLAFMDFCCFNVCLEEQERFQAYLARLQNIALDRPLVITQLGVGVRSHDERAHADALGWQIRASFEAGCAGAVVFSTDDWYSGGHDLTDCELGRASRDHPPKAVLTSVQDAYKECPFAPGKAEPFISVVVCSYNGARTIGECLYHLTRLNYLNYEVIVVDDGSTDNTAEIVQTYDVRLVQTRNCGLSAARNTGREHAQGEIVAYIDDDAYPDPDWLNYYALAFAQSPHALIGGPNYPPPDDPAVAQCVARSPGGPTHVLLTDTLAEHVPGCNMAFRKACLEEIGGFDPVFRTAGDDVDVCWRIQEKGWTVGFAPAAVVWHHRRASIRTYLRQQRGYGRAEALLHQKWPGRFNTSNHLPWAGRIYLPGSSVCGSNRSVISQKDWGEAPFQGLYGRTATLWDHLLEMPEVYLFTAALALLSAFGFLWPPMLVFLPVLGISLGSQLFRAGVKARQALFTNFSRPREAGLRILIAALHILQPLARLSGRLQYGLTPWKRRGELDPVFPYQRRWALWSETWIDPRERLRKLELAINGTGLSVWHGNAYEAWDLDVVGGLWASTRVLMAVEEHGSGKQYVRLAAWPRYSKPTLILTIVGIVIATAAAFSGQVFVAGVLAALSVLLFGAAAQEAGRSLAAVLHATEHQGELPQGKSRRDRS